MQNLPSRLGGFSVFAIHEDRQEILWFSSSSGLIKYDGKSFEVFTKESETANVAESLLAVKTIC